jgi:hypothetical protein
MNCLLLVAQLFTVKNCCSRAAVSKQGMPRIVTDLGRLPVLKTELALLRAFLKDEIDAILYGEG